MFRNNAFILPSITGPLQDLSLKLDPECSTEVSSHISRSVFLNGRMSDKVRSELENLFLKYILEEEAKYIELHGSKIISSDNKYKPILESDLLKINLPKLREEPDKLNFPIKKGTLGVRKRFSDIRLSKYKKSTIRKSLPLKSLLSTNNSIIGSVVPMTPRNNSGHVCYFERDFSGEDPISTQESEDKKYL